MGYISTSLGTLSPNREQEQFIHSNPQQHAKDFMIAQFSEKITPEIIDLIAADVIASGYRSASQSLGGPRENTFYGYCSEDIGYIPERIQYAGLLVRKTRYVMVKVSFASFTVIPVPEESITQHVRPDVRKHTISITAIIHTIKEREIKKLVYEEKHGKEIAEAEREAEEMLRKELKL